MSANILLFAQNLLESGVVTVTSEATGKPKARLYDRERGPQWQGTTNAAQDIDLDQLIAPKAFSHVGLVGYSITSGVEIYRGGSFPPSTLALSILSLAGGDPYIADLAGSFTDRYVRVRILSGGVTPAIGEVFIGTPQTVTLPPFLRNSGRATLGNVHRDVSPAGYVWAVRRGAKRSQFAYGWTGLTLAQLGAVQDAFDLTEQGSKPLILRDELGDGYWMNWQSDELRPVPVGAGLYELPNVVLEEAL